MLIWQQAQDVITEAISSNALFVCLLIWLFCVFLFHCLVACRLDEKIFVVVSIT